MSPRAGLSRESVVAAAAELADREGLDALTLAAVADELGVRSPSLYSHVNGIGALRDEIRAHGFDELYRRLSMAVAGRSRGEAVEPLARTLREFASSRPALYMATVRSPGEESVPAREARDRILQLIFAVAAGFGIAPDDLVHAARYLRSSLHGFVALELAGGFGLPRDVDESFDRLVDRIVAGLCSWPEAGPA